MPNNRGFSLIEAVVVSVMIAILAAVAVPSYLGYVQSTKFDVVSNLSQTTAAAANAYYRKTGTAITQTDLDNNKLNIFYDNTIHRITVSGNSITVTLIGSSPSVTRSITYR